MSKVLLEVDLSQAESRIVYCYSQDPALIARARTTPDQYDDHMENAKAIFETDTPTKEQRQMGKVMTHGVQRGMGPDKLADGLLKEGYVIPLTKCAVYIQNYLYKTPGLEEYFRHCRTQLLAHRKLENSWGRVWSVPYDRMNDELYRRCYGWYPQSEVADLLNQYGFAALFYWLEERQMQSKINLQVHDAVVVSCPVHEVWDVAQFLEGSLTQPHKYRGVELSMPAEYKVGTQWGSGVEWKYLPNRADMEAAAQRLLSDSLSLQQ